MQKTTEIASLVKRFLDNESGIDAVGVYQNIDGCTVYILAEQHDEQVHASFDRLQSMLFQSAPLTYFEIHVRAHQGRELHKVVPSNMHIYRRAVN